MKTKKHYNSFRTDLGFFVHLSDVEEWIESDSRIVSQQSYIALMIDFAR
jgi:aprataxin